MKITKIEMFPIRMNPIKTDYEYTGTINVIVRISTNAGISGLGEAAGHSSNFNQNLGSVLDWLRDYAEVLTGANPLDIIAAHRLMDGISGEYSPGCHPARAGVDLALFDIAGKAHNCPAYEVLGGTFRTEFELLTNLYEGTPKSKAAACTEYVKRGYRGLKVKVGASTIARGISVENFNAEKAKLVASLEVVPPDVYVDADANQSWVNAKIAVRIIEEVLTNKFYPNLALEQPIHHLDIEGCRYIRESLKIPLVLDEPVVSPQAMQRIVRHEAADRIVLKFSRVGGLWQARKIINICEAAGVGVSVDTMPFTLLGDTVNCHLAATIRDPYPVDAEGHLWFEDTPFTGGVAIKNGRASITSDAGFGVELDEKKLETMVIPT
jgi:L-Ala-D/L-Glu epimerase